MTKGYYLGSTLSKSPPISASTLSNGSTSQLSDLAHDQFHLDHIIIPIQLLFNSKQVKTFAMIDSGATSCFIDIGFIKKHDLTLAPKEVPRVVETVDGRSIASGPVTHETPLIQLQIGQHQEKIVFDAIQIGRYPVILGLPWLARHEPSIKWSRRQVTFRSKFCLQNCLDQPSTVDALSEYLGLPTPVQSAEGPATENLILAPSIPTSASSPDASLTFPTPEDLSDLGDQSVPVPVPNSTSALSPDASLTLPTPEDLSDLGGQSSLVPTPVSTSARAPDATTFPTPEDLSDLGGQSIPVPRISLVGSSAFRRSAKKG